MNQKTIFILLITFVPFLVLGQNDSDEARSIFSGGSEIKGFGAFEMKLTPIADRTSLFIGASGGVNVNKYFMLGVAGYGLASGTEISGEIPPKDLRLNGGYGGLLIGFNIFSREVVHLSIPIVFGAGKMYLTDPNFFSSNSDSEYTIENSAFMVVEPGAILVFNVTTFFRLGIGGSYRYVQGLNLTNLTDEQLLGWAINLNLKFGSF
jgi:hypothetical protein